MIGSEASGWWWRGAVKTAQIAEEHLYTSKIVGNHKKRKKQNKVQGFQSCVVPLARLKLWKINLPRK